MEISTAIEQLEKIKNEHGDIDVYHDADGVERPVQFISYSEETKAFKSDAIIPPRVMIE